MKRIITRNSERKGLIPRFITLGRPSNYTTVEGGTWFKWPATARFNRRQLRERSDSFIIMDKLTVHSLCWMRKGKMLARWDCVNGWTHR